MTCQPEQVRTKKTAAVKYYAVSFSASVQKRRAHTRRESPTSRVCSRGSSEPAAGAQARETGRQMNTLPIASTGRIAATPWLSLAQIVLGCV